MLDHRGLVLPTAPQLDLCDDWDSSWEWARKVTRGKKTGVVGVGDMLEGDHHKTDTQITRNPADQIRIARTLLDPIAQQHKGRFWIVRGTAAHVGESGCNEETLGESLATRRNRRGESTRFSLWIRLKGGHIVQCLHHIGTTASSAYEGTAPVKELWEMYVNSARFDEPRPDLIVRGHRHRAFFAAMPKAGGEAAVLILPAWQTKTPFAWKGGSRVSTAQIGMAVCYEDKGELVVRRRVVGKTDVEVEQ